MPFEKMVQLGPAVAKSEMATKLFNKLGEKLDVVLDKIDDPDAKFTTVDYLILSIATGTDMTK